MAIPPIKKIILKNIQSLPDAVIEPAPPGALTVVIGESDSGKTALASRALRKLFFNPSDLPNREIIRRGAKQAEIKIIYDTPDNLSVSWEWRGRTPDAGKARYVIARDNMDPIILEGGGKEVPKAVRDITGVCPVQIGKMSLNFNFNKQLDGPFLGAGVSPNERYRVLGSLAGTLEVDQAIKDVSLELLRARRREKEIAGDPDKGTAGEYGALEVKIQEYAYLKALGENIGQVEAALAEIQAGMALKGKLSGLLTEITTQEEISEDAELVALTLERWEQFIGQMLDDITVKVGRYQRLSAARDNINRLNTTLEDARGVIEKTNSIPELEREIVSLTEKQGSLVALKRLAQGIKGELQRLATIANILDVTRDAEMGLEETIRLSQYNHKRSTLMSLQAEIATTQAALSGYTDTLKLTSQVPEAEKILSEVEAATGMLGRLLTLREEIKDSSKLRALSDAVLTATAGADQGMELLAQVKDKADMLVKLRDLSGRIARGKEFIARVDGVLAATAGLDEGRDALTRVEAAVKSRDELALLRTQIDLMSKASNDRAREIAKLDDDIAQESEEYMALLASAGICEDCPAVKAVMAAAG